MSSSWPIVFAIFALVVAAFWYDATIAGASARATETPHHESVLR